MFAHSVKIVLLHGIIYYLLSRTLIGQAATTTNTTAAPTTNTTDPTTTNKTAAPTTNTTDPTTTNKTAAPTTNTTAASTTSATAPTTTNKTAAPTTNTTAPTTTTTTAAFTTSATAATTTNTTALTTPSTTAQSTTGPKCSSIKCGEHAKCVNTVNGYACECVFGFYNENDTCVEGKSFGGELTIDKTFNEKMKDKTSEEHKDLFNTITNIFKSTFGDRGYKSTFLANVRKGSVIVEVLNTFDSNSTVNESVIATELDNYKSLPGCDSKQCNSDSTVHCYQPELDLAECICKSGFYKKSQYDTICIESCNLKCKGKNQHCVPRAETHDFVCECQPGYKINSGICESCPFGYNGINCEDEYELAIVVTGIVAGVVILVLGITVMCACVRLKRIEPDEQETSLVSSMAPETCDTLSGNSRLPCRIPRIHLDTQDDIKRMPKSGPLSWLQRDSDQVDYSRQRPWNEMSKFENVFRNQNRMYDYGKR